MNYIIIFLLFSTQLFAQSMDDANKAYPQMHQEIIELTKNEEFLEVEKYSDHLKEIYFLALQGQVIQLKRTGKAGEELSLLVQILENLEYKEDEVSSLVNEVEEYQKNLLAKKWNHKFEIGVSFVSFQRNVTLASSQEKQRIINTSKSSCIGGGLNYQNNFWALNTSGCFLIGNSNLKEESGLPLYKESSVPLWGIKISQRASMVVSSSGSQIGISLPFFMNFQDLRNPTGDYQVKRDRTILIAPSFYGKWVLGRIYFETEIGQFLDQSNIFYSTGLGFTF